MNDKLRLDAALFERGLSESREKAKALVMSGYVYINGQKADKASKTVEEGDALEVRGNPIPFVSRGGLKLDKAVKVFNINVDGAIAADLGASTGGFTDCLLQNNAKKVYAVDVGYGQLDWRLRNDERVKVMERTNARNMQIEWFPEGLDFACMDVSFISIRLMLRPLYACLKENGKVVALIKPQFEAGREKVGKKGVVRDKAVHIEVIESLLNFSRSLGYAILGLNFSPITGPEGNIEFLLYLSKDGNSAWDQAEDTKMAENAAFGALQFHSSKV